MKVIKIDCPFCRVPDIIVDLEEGFDAIMNRVERQFVVDALEQAGGVRTRAAAALKMPVHALRHLVIKHDLGK